MKRRIRGKERKRGAEAGEREKDRKEHTRDGTRKNGREEEEGGGEGVKKNRRGTRAFRE